MQTALEIAKNINHLNSVRQEITNKDMVIVNHYMQKPSYQKANTIVIYDPRLHPYVVGIEASRLVEKWNKPTLIAGRFPQDPKGVARGSGRSIPEFNLFKALNPIRHDMLKFGGHPMACGFSIKADMVDKLRKDLENNAKDLGHVTPTVTPDVLITPQDITGNLWAKVHTLAPFGQDNEDPLFYFRTPRIFDIKQMGNDTLGFRLGNNKKATKCVGFKMGSEYAPSLKQNPYHLELIGNIKRNVWHHYVSIEFMVKKLRHYKVPMTRTQLGILYKGLKRLTMLQPTVTVRNVILNEKYDLSPTIIKHGLKIFTELHLINITSNYIQMNKVQQKVNLTASKTFNKLS